tara:strand:+ start:13581 stop:14261 length:681 start_codon:yes stop_codon:yes gene_type:complete
VSLRCFDLNPKTGKPKVYCVACERKTKSQTKAYRKTAIGKVKTKERNAKPSSIASKTAYRNSAEGKAKAKEYHGTETFLEKCLDYASSDKGKASRKKHYEDNKLCSSIMNAFARILRGGKDVMSPTAISNSSFKDEAHVRSHFQSLMNDTFTVWNYGDVWGIDHLIPKSAYDHDDPEDVLRCWSPENMRPLGIKANKEKFLKLDPNCIARVPSTQWPKAWCGTCPV